jgi:hypothetical protein
MSKYDNLFKTTYNSDVTRSTFKTNIFLSKDTNENQNIQKNFNYKEELFPDLSVNKVGTSIVTNTINTNSKNYANIAATVNEEKIAEKNPVLPGWIQYSKSNKNTTFFDVTYGDKTKRQIEQELQQEKQEALLNDPIYIHNKTMFTLANNWNKYKQQYDEIHGEGAYELAYYTEPIYPLLDENLSDDEKEPKSYSYSSEEEYYSYEKY